jgi:hypothetical protein
MSDPSAPGTAPALIMTATRASTAECLDNETKIKRRKEESKPLSPEELLGFQLPRSVELEILGWLVHGVSCVHIRCC